MMTMPPPGADGKDAQFRMQINATSCLLLAHKLDWALVKPFIEAGGLLSLVNMISHESMQIRGQVRTQCTNLIRSSERLMLDPQLVACMCRANVDVD